MPSCHAHTQMPTTEGATAPNLRRPWRNSLRRSRANPLCRLPRGCDDISLRSPSASSPGGGSRSGSPSWTAPGSTARSRRSAATTSRSPSTIRARRAVGRPCGRAGSWGSPRSLRSVFLRRADERVLAGPVGRLLVHALDVALELEAVHPPHPAPAELDGGQLAAADQRVDLGDPDVEDRGHVLQRVEPGLDAGCGHAVLLGAVKIQVAELVRAACDRSSLSFPHYQNCCLPPTASGSMLTARLPPSAGRLTCR